MEEIFKSATKITLLSIVGTICITTLGVVFFNLSNGDVTKTILAVFSNAVALVIGFYFGQKVLPVK